MPYIASFWNTLLHSDMLWETVEIVGTGLVILGVVGEYLVEFRSIPKDEIKRKKFSKGSATILIIGLAIELLGLVRTSQLTSQKIANLQSQAQQAHLEAEDARLTAKGFESEIAAANARAKSAEAIVATASAASQNAVATVASANARIAGANARAAEAVEAAETERLARVKIEERLSPRSLSPQQQEKIESVLKGYPGTPYELSVNPSPESTQLLIIIDAVLRKSGWTAHDSARKDLRMTVKLQTGPLVEEGIFSKVTVMIATSMIAKYNLAASALVSGLRNEGIETNYNFLPESDPSPDNIHVMVGTKE